LPTFVRARLQREQRTAITAGGRISRNGANVMTDLHPQPQTPRSTLRRRLADACDAAGLLAPRDRERKVTWIARVMDEIRDWPLADNCDPEEYDLRPAGGEHLAERYLQAAWRAADGWDDDLAQRMLHGAHTFMRIANQEYYREDMYGERTYAGEYSCLGSPSSLERLVGAIPDALYPGQVPCDETLVIYPMNADGESVPDWMWSEGFGYHTHGWIVDDGEWREMFDKLEVAREAIADWQHRRRGVGRGLPYVDSEEHTQERQWEAEADDTTLERLMQLAQDRDYAVAAAAAENAKASAEVLIVAARHTSDVVLERVAELPDLPDEAVDLIATNGTEEDVMRLIESRLVTDGLLARVAADSLVRRVITRDLDFEEAGYSLPLLSVVVEDPEYREAILRSVPEKVEAELLRAAGPSSPWVEAYSARLEDLNRRIPPGVLRRTYAIVDWSDWDTQV